jgi:toxin-antitoxin system PIN domain toxin
MIAVDTNILIYAHREDSAFHLAAKACIEALRRQLAPWAIPWPCLHEFIAIATHPGIYKPPSVLAEALGFVDSLLASPQLHLLAESPGYFEKLRVIATAAKLKGPRIHDARIAAICLHHGATELWSVDRDFSAFPQLKVRNPLAKGAIH